MTDRSKMAMDGCIKNTTSSFSKVKPLKGRANRQGRREPDDAHHDPPAAARADAARW